MPKLDRTTHRSGGEVTVFIIGMRINRLRAVHRWLPVFAAMPRMLHELTADPSAGLLAARTALSGRSILVIQYWRSAAQLHAYAADPNKQHRPAWQRLMRSQPNPAVGIFHETYVVAAERMESIQLGMPPFGLGRALGVCPIERARDRFRDRLPTAC